jgi:hypothetical protein
MASKTLFELSPVILAHHQRLETLDRENAHLGKMQVVRLKILTEEVVQRIKST